jgi:hypothetical protein
MTGSAAAMRKGTRRNPHPLSTYRDAGEAENFCSIIAMNAGAIFFP